ncbi:MAG: hypothetical protein J5699_01715 [Bacteroidales bacterium]|nr:hypothetical protein [Bacteroidales bacterium]
MEDRYTEQFMVPSHMVDGGKKLGTGNILHIFQELSYNGSHQLGCGEDLMESRGFAWIFSRIHIVIRRRPSINEIVRMETWSKGLEGLFFNRQYRILDSDGEPILLGCGLCLVINLESRALVRSDRISQIVESWEQNPEEAASTPAKLTPCDGYGSLPLLSHRVMYSETDFVGHVNNSQYLRWAVDCEKTVNPAFFPVEITINFLKETKLGDTIEYYRAIRDGRINYAARVGGATVMLLEMN